MTFQVFLNWLFKLSLAVYFAVLVARSGLFLVRSSQEVISLHQPTEFHPEIKTCQALPPLATTEQTYLYNYRQLGVTCLNSNL